MELTVHQLLQRLGDQWSLPVIKLLFGQTVRFSDAARTISGISEKMLAKTLRALERDGFVKRTVHPVMPPHVEYELTPLGGELHSLVSTIQAWVRTHEAELATCRQDDDTRQAWAPGTTANATAP